MLSFLNYKKGKIDMYFIKKKLLRWKYFVEIILEFKSIVYKIIL